MQALALELTVIVYHRIDDRKSANPRMRGFLHGSGIIFRERGIRGFFQGFVPTTARQAANSATRFGSYTTIKQFAQGYVAPGEKLGTISTFGIGGLAGLITVYVVIQGSKAWETDTGQVCNSTSGYHQNTVSRISFLLEPQCVLNFNSMQSIDARKEYKNSFVCAAKIFKQEGVLTFWSGAVPRLARLVLSGGIVFTM